MTDRLDQVSDPHFDAFEHVPTAVPRFSASSASARSVTDSRPTPEAPFEATRASISTPELAHSWTGCVSLSEY